MRNEFERYRQMVEQGVWYLSDRFSTIPETAVVLGTGLGSVIDGVEGAETIPYGDIPGFPVSTVVGHAGNLVCGELAGKGLVALQGRFHYYEGYSTRELTIPIRVLGLLGVKRLIVTNAAGGLNPGFSAGDIMLIEDHINLIGDNPLRGPNIDDWGERFPDMSQVYDRRMAGICRSVALDPGMHNLVSGVYCAVPGPSLETPAETRYLRQCGADAVGMSTVPEVIVARHSGMDVLGLSVIANVNDPEYFQPIEVSDILAKMGAAASTLKSLLLEVLGAF